MAERKENVNDGEVLSDEIYKHEKAFVEERDFIKKPPQRKFKSIIANPPYIRHHRIDGETKIFLYRVHFAHTVLPTTRKKMAIAIILLLPTHAQDKTWELFGNTSSYLCDYMPLAPLEPAVP